MKKYFFWLLPLAWALLIWHLTTTPQIVVTQDFWLQQVLMMLAHFLFFGIQGALLYLAFLYQPLIIGHWPLILTSLYGALIEFYQLSVPGRSADLLDWILDTLGVIFFLYMFKKLKFRI